MKLILNGENEDKKTIIEENETVEENLVFEQIVENYNAQHPETPISVEDLGIIKTNPQFLIEETKEDGSIQYIQNYKIRGDNLEENQEVIYNEPRGYSTDGIYTVVNKKDKTIVLSEGIINNYVKDIDTRIVKGNNNIEYIANEENLSIKFESEADRTSFYIDLKNKFQEILEEKLAEEKTEDYEIGD